MDSLFLTQWTCGNDVLELCQNPEYQDVTIICDGGKCKINSFLLASVFPIVKDILKPCSEEMFISLPDIVCDQLSNFFNSILLRKTELKVPGQIFELLSNSTLKYEEIADDGYENENLDCHKDLRIDGDSFDGKGAGELYKPVKIKLIASRNKQCNVCGIKTINLRRHIASKHKEQLSEYDKMTKVKGQARKYPKKCEFCPKIVIDSYKYHRHLKTHKELTVDVIENILQNISHRNVTKAGKKRKYPKKCEFCPQMSPDSYKFERHRKSCKYFVATESDDSLLSLFCEECGKRFDTSKALKCHQIYHKSELR